MPRVIAILTAVLWIAAALWATDAQMRESDQASLLMGAVELARGEASWVGNGSYNYDKQYLSYWVVAGVLKATGGVGSGATIEGVVRGGNYAAVILFSFALMVVVAVRREWSWVTVAVLACVLLSPVVAFTGVLLSSNLISGAFVLLLVAVLGYGQRVFQPAVLGETTGSASGLENPRSIGAMALVFLLAFAAVAARQDAILLMPLLAALVVRWDSWRTMLKSPALWTLAAGSLLAMITGRLIDPSPTPLPEPFFAVPTFVAYLAGGLGGCLLALLVFSGRLVSMRSRESLMLGCAVLLPLVFYGCLLYTPRHLLTAALALAVTVLLPRGGELWSMVVSKRIGRVLVVVVGLASFLPWFVGVRMTGWTRGGLVATRSSLYPTADGFWPLGAYGSFFLQLGRGSTEPIDHNQEVWAAWADLDDRQLPPGKGAIISSGLTSYGWFALSWLGRDFTGKASEADYVLFDDRTIAKRQLGVNLADLQGRDLAGELLTTGRVQVVGSAFGRSIMLWTAEGRGTVGVDEGVSLRAALSEGYGGNDFRMRPWEEAEWKRRSWPGHRIMLAARSTEVLEGVTSRIGESLSMAECRSAYDPQPWFAVGITDGQLRMLVEDGAMDGGDLWVACGMLPAFMDVRKYGK